MLRLPSGWDLSQLILLCANHSSTTRQEEGILHSTTREFKKGCGKDIQNLARSMAIIQNHARKWGVNDLDNIINMHNLIVEDKR